MLTTELINNEYNQSGIYMILNLSNGKYYIGSAINFRERWNKHISDLNSNKHHSKYLQYSWNKYSDNNFQLVILEFVEIENLTYVEQVWINSSNCINSEFGYNTSPTAQSALGIKRSEETRKRMSISRKSRNPASQETRLKMSLAKKGKRLSLNCLILKRNLDKWPHELGNRCKCKECKIKTNAKAREYYAKK